jgi:hypothetical protein
MDAGYDMALIHARHDLARIRHLHTVHARHRAGGDDRGVRSHRKHVGVVDVRAQAHIHAEAVDLLLRPDGVVEQPNAGSVRVLPVAARRPTGKPFNPLGLLGCTPMISRIDRPTPPRARKA